MSTNRIRIEKIFISHSSKDKAFGDALVKLLRGIGLTQKQIIYTSDSNYGIPPGENIFSYLRDQIGDNTYMIYLLSDHYYNSIVCLNEMGAAWVRQAGAQMLLLPGFDVNNPKFQNGVSDPRMMAVKLDDDIQMRKIVSNIIQMFQLDPLNTNIQNAYNGYLQEIRGQEARTSVQAIAQLAETERKLESKPQDPWLYQDKGCLLYTIDDQNYPESVQSLLYAMYLDPNFSEAYYRLLQVAGTHHDFLRSLTVAEEAMRRFPQNPDSYGCYAYALKNQGREKEAVENLCEAIRRNPDKWYYYMRGTSYYKLGDLENALSDLWTIYQQYDPGYEDTVMYIKEICRKIGLKNLYDRAVGLAAQVEKASRTTTGGAGSSEFAESQKYYTCILLTEPDNKDALREFGGLCYSVGQYDKALQHWTRLLELEQSAYHYFLCAVANKYLGDIAAARNFVNLGLASPDDGYHKELRVLL